MQKKPVKKELLALPEHIESMIKDADIFDSSSSNEAKVYFIEKDRGYYLKRSPKGKLAREAMMTRYFAEKGLAARVLSYESLEEDWMLTLSVKGEDCVHSMYMEKPEKLCDTLAEILLKLHSLEAKDCPVLRMGEYFDLVRKNYLKGMFDQSYALGQTYTPEQAFNIADSRKELFTNDTLIHGDFCLPNIILDNWKLSAFIDLDNAGLGDKHIDIYWALWSMRFNFKTDKYSKRFLDGYGKDRVNCEKLEAIAAAECFG